MSKNTRADIPRDIKAAWEYACKTGKTEDERAARFIEMRDEQTADKLLARTGDKRIAELYLRMCQRSNRV